jgi:hypothetical protein
MVWPAFQPVARIFAVSRKMNGLSPIQPRSPPVETERPADDANGIVHLDVFRGPQVVDLRVMPGLRCRREAGDVHYCIDAILHIEVALALGSVAKHAQPAGVFKQLPVEVEHMAVGVPFPEDRDETENVALKSEGLAVGGNKAFACHLGGSIERSLNGERRVLRRGDDRRLAVD